MWGNKVENTQCVVATIANVTRGLFIHFEKINEPYEEKTSRFNWHSCLLRRSVRIMYALFVNIRVCCFPRLNVEQSHLGWRCPLRPPSVFTLNIWWGFSPFAFCLECLTSDADKWSWTLEDLVDGRTNFLRSTSEEKCSYRLLKIGEKKRP